MLESLGAYTDGGGKLVYLGGNGFYWRIGRSACLPGVIEVRRAEGGIRAWSAEPGEYYQSLDGAYGGLWRRNARPPQRLVGVGFSGQGLFEGFIRMVPVHQKPPIEWCGCVVAALTVVLIGKATERSSSGREREPLRLRESRPTEQ